MFGTLLEKNFISLLEEKALPTIKKNREIYKDARNTVKEFCKNNPVYLSNVNILIGDEEGYDPFEIHCDNPYKYGLELVNQLYLKNTKYVVLKTIVQHEHLEIFLNTIKFASIFVIKKIKNFKTSNMILPTIIDGIKYVSSDVELIDIYRNLYNPNKRDDWENLYSIEKKLYEQILKRKETLGGVCCDIRKNEDLNKLKKILLEEFILKGSYIIIGSWANSILYNTISKEKLQIISKNKIENDIQEIIEFLGKYTDFKIIYKKRDINIPGDFRTDKYTIYIEYTKFGKKKELSIIDIYNSGQFELIPYIKKDNYLIGNPYVLFRFILIDIWVLRIIYASNYITKDFLKIKIHDLFKLMNNIREKNWEKNIFGVDYYGIFQDYNVSKKIDATTKLFSYPYYPFVEDKNNGLRTV